MRQVNINLLPWRENQFKRKKMKFILFFSGTVLLSLVSIVSMNLLLSYQIKQLMREKDKLIDQLTTLSIPTKKTIKLKQHTEQLENTLRQLHTDQQQIRKILEMLEDIKLLAPTEFIIRDITYKSAFITIVGSPLTNNNFLQLQNALAGKYRKKIKWNYSFKKNLTLKFSLV